MKTIFEAYDIIRKEEIKVIDNEEGDFELHVKDSIHGWHFERYIAEEEVKTMKEAG